MKQLFALAFLLVTAVSVNAQDALPSVQLTNLKGEKVDIATLHQSGKIIVLDFWATWCVPCKKSLTNMAPLYEEWQKKYNVEIVAVSTDDARNTAKVKSQVDGAAWPYTILLDPNQEMKRALNFQNIPFSVLLNKEGKIVYQHTGYVDGDEYVLEEEIKKIAGI